VLGAEVVSGFSVRVGAGFVVAAGSPKLKVGAAEAVAVVVVAAPKENPVDG
jgi:hypothetical protein